MAFINDHWDDHHSVEKDIYKFIFTQFPQFRYEGEGFRGVINSVKSYNPHFNLIPFTCWSKSQVGVIQFLNHEIIDQAFLEGDDCFIIESKVKGIDVSKIALYLHSQKLINLQQLNLFLKEEEIVNLTQLHEATQKVYSFSEIEKAIKQLL